MTRFHNWQSRLDAFLTANAEATFRYGQWDCCLFACDAIQAMTGTDVAEWFRGRYKSRREALAAIREYAGKASVKVITEKVTEENGMTPVPVLSAQRGDVALIKRGARDHSLGIVALNGREVIGLAARGLWRVPVTDAVRCWRV